MFDKISYYVIIILGRKIDKKGDIEMFILKIKDTVYTSTWRYIFGVDGIETTGTDDATIMLTFTQKGVSQNIIVLEGYIINSEGKTIERLTCSA